MQEYKVVSGSIVDKNSGGKLVRAFGIVKVETDSFVVPNAFFKSEETAKFWCEVYNEIPAVMKCASI